MKEISAPTDYLNTYSESTDRATRLSGSLSKRNRSETLQASIYNFPQFGDYKPSNSSVNQTSANFAYAKGTVQNSTLAKTPGSNVPPSSAEMQDISAVRTTISRFAPNSRKTQSRMTVSGENSISATVPMTTHQYKSDSTAVAHFQKGSKAKQSLELFLPSTRRSNLSKSFFAPNPASYIQSAKNEFGISAEENTLAISNVNNLLGTNTTTWEKEAEPESISFIGITALMKEGNGAKTDATDIPENYKTSLDVPDMEDKSIIIIDNTHLERYGKTVSDAPDLPQKDNSILTDAIDMKTHYTTTVNTQTPSIFSARNSNDFESISTLHTYNKADTKSITIATDIDEVTSNINPTNTISNINPTNPFLNYRMHKKNNNVISNSNNIKTMLDIVNMMRVEDLPVSKTNGTSSRKHYANSNFIEPKTNPNINFKIMWPSKEGPIIEGRHTVQIENIRTPTNNNVNNIAEATGSKVGDSITKYHSNIHDNVYSKTDRNNFKSVNIDGIEFVIPVVQEIANMDQDDGIVKEVIFLHPDTSITKMRRKVYSLNPNADYAQTAGKKIIPDMLNPLFKYKIKPFAMDNTNLINNRGDHGTPTTITTNNAKTKLDSERSTVFKTANFQNNIIPIISVPHPGTIESVNFSKDNRADTISASKVSAIHLDKPIDSVDKAIRLSTNNNQSGGIAGPNPETDFPMNTLLSVAESPILISNAQNDQAPNSLLIKDDSLTGTWISDPVTENPHLINDAITQKWKISKVLVDPLNIPLQPTLMTADFTFPNGEYNFSTSAGKGTSSVLMINKTTLPEIIPTAKSAGILTPRKQFGSLIDKKLANKESTPSMEVMSVVEEDIFQMKEDLPPAHNFKYFETGDNSFEKTGFVAVDTTKSLSHLSSIIPIAEVTITDRDLTTSGKENDVLYDVTKPVNDKIHFKAMVTKTKVNDLGENAAVKQKVEALDGTEFLPPSNSTLQTGRIDHPILPNLYSSVITNNPLTMENPNLAQNIMKPELSLTTMDNAYLTDYRDGYQTTSSDTKTLADEDKMAGTEITDIPLGITPVADDVFYVNKNTEVQTDLASIAAISPIKKGIWPMNEVGTFNSSKLGDDFTISRDDPNVSRDNGLLLTADTSTFIKSVAPLQATTPVIKASLADIMMPKTFHSKFTPEILTVAVTTASQDVDTMFYTPRYKSENSFKEDIALNYEADLPKYISIMEENEVILKENVRNHTYIIPIADDNVPKGNNLAAKHYSLNSDVYNSINFKGTTKTTDDQFEFENPASSHMAEVSKPLHGKFTPEFQGKVVVSNSDNDAEHDAFFSDDSLYLMMKESVPKGYTFSPESSSLTSDFSISMNDNINSAVEKSVLLGKETSSKNSASYVGEQTYPGIEQKQIVIGSITHSPRDIIPVTSFVPVSSEDINVENYYHISETDTPLLLGYANTLRDDSSIHRPMSTLARKNNLDAMDLIIMKPDKSDSKYISNNHIFELEKKENSPITKPMQFIHGPNGFVSPTPSSKSLLYRITLPEFKTKEKHQTMILKEENSDPDILATSFKDYIKNFNTQHLKTMAPSLIGAGETFPSVFLEKSSAGKSTLSKDDAIIAASEFSDVRNKKNKYFFVPHMETINMENSKMFNSVPTDHVISTPIEHHSHFYRKCISSNICNTAALELGDSVTSEKLKVNENKMDFTEVMPSEDHSNQLAQDTASQAENISYVGEVTKGIIKTVSIASLNSVDANKMQANASNLTTSAPAFDSKEINEYYDSTMPEVHGVLTIKLKSLLIPNQKRLRTEVAFSENDYSFPNKLVTLEVSETRLKHSIIDKNWGVSKMQSDPQPFSVVSSVPPEDPITISRDPIDVATDLPITENGSINDKTDTLAFPHNIALQPAIPKKGQTDEISHHAVSHHVNKAVINPSAEEITTSGTGTNALLSKDEAVVKDVSHIRKGQLYMGDVIFTSLYDQRKTIISPKPEYNKDKICKTESYHSQDGIAPLVTFNVNLDNESSFVPEASKTTKSRVSTSSSLMNTAHSMTDIIALFLQNSYEGGDSMQPDENSGKSRKFPFIVTTDSVILMPKILTEDPTLMNDNFLSDSSKSVSVVLETMTEYLDLIHGTDISGNQDIQFQTDLQPHSLESIILSINSTTFTKNSTDDEANLTSTVERKTSNISKVKTNIQSLSTIMKVLSTRQRNPFPSEIRKIAELSAEEDIPAQFDLGYIINATPLIPTLEKILPSTTEPNALSKSNKKDGGT